jgi:hypothetical protein
MGVLQGIAAAVCLAISVYLGVILSSFSRSPLN